MQKFNILRTTFIPVRFTSEYQRTELRGTLSFRLIIWARDSNLKTFIREG